ncbi:MAG: ROK family protein [Ignavibacteria bacterium]|nr:ROK family protein [Ignavibacteria bacterium]
MANQVVLGIDIGGTNTAFGLVDRLGNIIVETSIPTNNQQNEVQFFERLFPAIEEMLLKHEDSDLIGIGIGAPNANYYSGTVEKAPNLNWSGVVPISKIVEEHFHVPVKITNDANAAALGEMLFGTAKGMKDFIVITLGTGLGSGIVCNGQLLYGHDGFAGEVGHIIVIPNGRDCGCGRKGCLEAYASATGIKRTVSELLCNSQQPSLLRELTYNEITSKMIFEAAIQHDAIAEEAFQITGEILGRALANAIAFTSPEAIILFGGLALSGETIRIPTQKAMDEYTLNIFHGKTKLLISKMQKANTAVLGASALIWQEHVSQ